MKRPNQNILIFTKPGCKNCTWVKDQFDLKKLGVTVHSLTNKPTLEGVEALSLLAWFECVQLAETTMPILIVDSKLKSYKIVTGAILIKKELLKI